MISRPDSPRSSASIPRPDPSEYAPYCAKYIALVVEQDVRTALADNADKMQALLQTVTEFASLLRYAPGKWTIREMIVHVTDVERIQSYRVLRIARGEMQPLAGFDPASYVAASHADQRPWDAIREEFSAVRDATLALFGNLPDDAWARRGIADGFPLSVRAAAYVIAGHGIHHCNLLREKYIPLMAAEEC